MKIAYVLNSGNPGGTERHVLDLVKGMVKRGHRVFVWCKDGEIAKWYEEAGAEVYRSEITSDIDPKYILNLVNFLRSNKIDVLHAHDLKPATNALFASIISRTKVKITHIHTPMSEWQVPSTLKKIVTFIQIRCYSFLVNTFSDSEIALTNTRKIVKLAEGISDKKLTIIHNGLDETRLLHSEEEKKQSREAVKNNYGIPQEAFVIGVISRISEEKGHTVLLKAFKSFLDKNNELSRDVYLIIAGGGPLENELRQKVQEMNFDGKVIVTGIFPDDVQPMFYDTFDIFVFPSLAEGFGLVLIEAMLCNIPVICSDLDVLKEVSGLNAVFFKTGDYVDLSRKLYEMRSQMVQSTYEPHPTQEFILKNYSMDKFITEYENLYGRFLTK